MNRYSQKNQTDSLFNKNEDDGELSIDLDDANLSLCGVSANFVPPCTNNAAQTSNQGQNQSEFLHQLEDRSFMSDLPDDFLQTPSHHRGPPFQKANNNNSNKMQQFYQPLGEAAPASGTTMATNNILQPSIQQQYAGTKRRRVQATNSAGGGASHHQHQTKAPSHSSSSHAYGAISTQFSSQQNSTNKSQQHQRQEQNEDFVDQCDILSGTGDFIYPQQNQQHRGVAGPEDEAAYYAGFPGSFNNQATDSSVDSIAAMRKSKNRDAAKRSRQKKKAEQNLLLNSNDRVHKENNKLKLDNAALRAENQILKRQLTYWENLFAKKTQSQQVINSSQQLLSQQHHHTQVIHHQRHQGAGGPFDHHSSATHTQTHSSGSVISGDDMIRQRRSPTTPQGDGMEFKTGENMAQSTPDEEGEISFVLERNPSASPTGNKLGLFSLALIMCICCFSSFFGPLTTAGHGSGSVVLGSDGNAVQMVGGGSFQPHGSWELKQVSDGMADSSASQEQVSTMVHGGTDQQGTATQSSPSTPVDQQNQQMAATFAQVVLHAFWVNLLKVVFLVAFAFCLLLFPKDEIVQWAARKPFFRKIFDFSEVPIAAQTKFIKSDKLV